MCILIGLVSMKFAAVVSQERYTELAVDGMWPSWTQAGLLFASTSKPTISGHGESAKENLNKSPCTEESEGLFKNTRETRALESNTGAQCYFLFCTQPILLHLI